MARRRAPAPAVTPEDAALFRDAIGPVREIAPTAAPPQAPRPAPQARQPEADEAAALAESRQAPFAAADRAAGLEYLRDGFPPRLLRQLRRGQFALQDELDLHRMNAAEALAALRRFLHECRDAERFCVRIVHGKGLGSGPEGPVLKGAVDRLLRHRDDVIAFTAAPPAQGGSGAVLVLLARRRA